MVFSLHYALIFATLVNLSLQDCPRESSIKGIRVTWPSSSSAENVTSKPLCFRHERLVTRNCNGNHWEPDIHEMQPCEQIANYFDLSRCPPGHYPISDKSDYCYQINKPSSWNNPCYKNGKTSVITDLDENEMMSLLTSLNATPTQKYYWLPAQRSKLFNPVVWHIPGPNWGRLVETNKNHNYLKMRTYMLKNCLLLDVEQKTILTELCSMKYPSLCFSINEFRYPSNCPDNYHSLRFMPDDTTCYGIEESDDEEGLTFDEFLETKCRKPSPSVNSYSELMRYVFTNLATLSNLNKTTWCWFQLFISNNVSSNITALLNEDDGTPHSEIPQTQSIPGIINGSGTLSITRNIYRLPCMVCEVEMKLKETEFIFEYNEVENKMYLTVYYPSGLWKYDDNDKGIQCFSNAKGFVKVVNVNDEPIFQLRLSRETNDLNNADKVVYEIDPVTYRAAQYWCEGHTKNFSLITTNKLIVNPNCNEEHVFAIVIEKYNVASDTEEPDMSNLISNITEIFHANKVLVMDILDFSAEHMLLLMHLHVAISDYYDDKASNIQDTFVRLKERAETELPRYNYTFVNISSSICCLPTSTEDTFKLNWDLTAIGHMTAPQQFCLQANGLPVKRRCHGSYLLGGTWGEVEGICDSTYEPSWTTKFLFDFVKGNTPDNATTHFLTNGLGAVLGNGSNMIPADIYYLSISLQHVLYLADNNKSMDLGDIDNVAWVMDRVMSLDKSYLRLSQTLNSTNVILDSVNDIIEHLIEEQTCNQGNCYSLTIKPQFIVQISYPEHNNVTGIAIIKNKGSNNFTEMLIQPLFKNSTLSDVLAIQNLEIATWLSDKMLESMKISSNDSSNIFRNNSELHIVISVFYNDAVFQEVDIKTHEINSRVIGISIPGYTSNLKHGVPLIFKDLKAAHTGDTFCGYWNFLTDVTQNAPGLWAKKGCLHYESKNNITVCECYHLTHFGQLLNTGTGGSSVNQEIQIHHKKVLNIITLVGSFLSLAGIVGIWVTASVFSAWRQKAGTKVLLHLSTAIAMPLIFIIVFNVDTTIFIHEEGVYKVAEHMKVTCIILGALLHYSILASFMWMFITAALQFLRYVQVLGVYRPSRFMIKCTVVGWGVPLIPISVILLLEKDNYIPESTKTEYGKYLICYPSGFILVMSVIVPICLILAVNIALFVIILCSIYRGPDGKMRATDMDLIGAQFRLSIFLFFLLGLTWMFGILSFTNNLLWSYLFCLTSTLQGLVLFVYFVICDPSTRNMWITLMTPNFRTRPRKSITSISSG